MSAQNSRAWFPGIYVPAANLRAVEVLSPVQHRRVEATVSKSTVFHGTPSQVLAAAVSMLRAVIEADPTAAAKVAPLLATLDHSPLIAS